MNHTNFRFTVVVLAIVAVVLGLLPQVRAQDTVEATTRNEAQSISGADAPAAAASVANASPTVFSYQGQLSNAAGTPITNASLPMTFRLFTTLTGGTACWTENQNVNVQNGQFSVLLGQTTAVPASCLAGNAYLELVVSGETLSPREMLTSVATAAKSNTLVSDAATQGPMTIAGDLTLAGTSSTGGNPVNIGVIKALPGSYSLTLDNATGGSTRMVSGENLMFFLDADDNSTSAGLGVYRNSNHLGGNVAGVMNVSESGNLWLSQSADIDGNLNVDGYIETKAGSVSAYVLRAANIELDGITVFHQNGTDRTLHLLPWVGGTKGYDRVCVGCGTEGSAWFDVRGRVTAKSLVVGNCQIGTATGRNTAPAQNCEGGSIVSGSYVEANLMTPEEMAAEAIARFEKGDLLCWAAESEQLELCTMANDRLVMAVADANGKPIVLGAEPVKVVGPVEAGDLLVASNTPGHAMANNDAPSGTVIGQALQSLDGSSGIIKAMIRKW